MAYQAVIVDGVRTPFLKVGTVPDLNAVKLGVVPIQELMRRYPGLEKTVDAVVGANIGNQLLPPDGSNITRIVALHAGIPQEVDARTININCGSGLEAVSDAVMRVELGLARCVLVTAVEVMSDYTAAYGRRERERFAKTAALARAKSSILKKGPALAVAAAKLRFMAHDPQWLIRLGLTDPFCGLGMDKISDSLASEWKLTREEVDLYAQMSQRRAEAARKSGRLAKEIVSFGGLNDDNGIRDGQTLGQLAKLRPLNATGVTTAGNASQVTDGAAAILVVDKGLAKEKGWPMLAEVDAFGTTAAGCDPKKMGLGPVNAIRKLLKRYDWKLDRFDIVETNEAFASVVLAQSRLLKEFGEGEFNWERTNINGGAIALGHPISASGARLALTCAKELNLGNGRLGLVTACVGGGQGVAAILRRAT